MAADQLASSEKPLSSTRAPEMQCSNSDHGPHCSGQTAPSKFETSHDFAGQPESLRSSQDDGNRHQSTGMFCTAPTQAMRRVQDWDSSSSSGVCSRDTSSSVRPRIRRGRSLLAPYLVLAALGLHCGHCLQATHSGFHDPGFMAGLGHSTIPSQSGRGASEPSVLSSINAQRPSENLAMLDSSGVKVASPQAMTPPMLRKPLLADRSQDKAFGKWRSDLNMVLKSWCAWASRGSTTSLFAAQTTSESGIASCSVDGFDQLPPQANKVNAAIESQTLLRIPPPMHSATIPPRLSLRSGASNIPHPQKLHRGGEDVHMVVHEGGNTLIGVFDGVGGWADVGVDPALYARQLAAILQREFRQSPSGAPGSERPLQAMLQTAHQELEAAQLPGSCTVCLALLKSDGELHILNLGDSSLHILRDGVTVFQTAEQQHYFNCPFQLGLGSGDQPPDGDYYIVDDLAETDLIVAATDGLWDNLYEEDVRGLAGKFEEPQHLAAQLAIAASVRAQDSRYRSPFSVQAARNGVRHAGGKLDDVTVVAAVAVPGGTVSDREKGALADVDKELLAAASAVSSGESAEDVDLEQQFNQGF